MTQVTTRKAEYVEFEILKGSGEAVRAASPWRIVRFVAIGAIGVALFGAMLALGMLLLIPLLIFFAITRIISTLLPAAART